MTTNEHCGFRNMLTVNRAGEQVCELLKKATNSQVRCCMDKTYARNGLLAAVDYFFSLHHSQRNYALLFNVMINEQLAVELTGGSQNSISIDITPQVLLLAHYFQRQYSAPSAFGDLRNYVDRLTIPEQKALLLICRRSSFEDGHDETSEAYGELTKDIQFNMQVSLVNI